MSQVKMNWPLVAIGVVVMAVPFSIALIQDLGRESTPASEGDWTFEKPYDESSYDDAELDEMRARLAEYEQAAAEAETEARVWQRTAMSEDFFNWLLGSQSDMSDSVIRKEYFGLSRTELVAQAPELTDWLFGFDTRFAEAAPTMFPPEGPLATLTITFVDDGSALRILADRWGAGDVADDGYVRWIHDGAGVIVSLLEGDSTNGEARLTIESQTQPNRDR